MVVAGVNDQGSAHFVRLSTGQSEYDVRGATTVARRKYRDDAPDTAELVSDVASEGAPPEAAGRVGTPVIRQAETVNISITVVNDGGGEEAPLLTVLGP